MQNQTIKFGIIGTGKIAVDAHIPAIREAGGEIVALADVAEGRAKKYADDLGISCAFTDYRELLAMKDIDAVSICTPPVSHESIAIECFQAGKHVYLEKPVAMNEREMIHIYKASREADKRLLVGSQLVYGSEIQLAKTLADQGKFGKIYMIKSMNVSRREMPHGWFRKKGVSGGFAVIDGGSHILDRVLYLMGNPKPVSVTARTFGYFAGHKPVTSYKPKDYEEGADKDIPEMEVEDSAVAFIQFDNGCVLFLENSTASNSEPMSRTWIYGTKAGATFNPLTIYGEEMQGTVYEKTMKMPADTPRASHRQAFGHLIQCIEQAVDTESNGERAITVMRIVDAIYKSAETGGREVILERAE